MPGAVRERRERGLAAWLCPVMLVAILVRVLHADQCPALIQAQGTRDVVWLVGGMSIT